MNELIKICREIWENTISETPDLGEEMSFEDFLFEVKFEFDA